MKRKIVFLTGTRADYGKLKPLIARVEASSLFDCYVFVTGMHMLERYGYTYEEVLHSGYSNIHPFMNQTVETPMDLILANTISGFHNYLREIKPDLVVVHGDRIEALAAAIASSCNNILLAHIEGGEVSGTIDESIRHAVTKFSQIHFVSNKESRQRLLQLGENGESIYVIGSPDIDVMKSNSLPALEDVRDKYDLPQQEYAIFSYHPVTTELGKLPENIRQVTKAIERSGLTYVVIYPNNDPGSDIIINEIQKLEEVNQSRVLPSLRFEYYLTLLKNSEFIIGNSSAGIREAGVYGIPAINIGTRQANRSQSQSIIHVSESEGDILAAISKVTNGVEVCGDEDFGDGNSADSFMQILSNDTLFHTPIQKRFQDNYLKVFELP